MANTYSPCIGQYFNDLSQVGFASNLARFELNAGNLIITAPKPFIPYVGMLNNGAGGHTPDTMVNNQLFRDMFLQLFQGALQASQNNVAGAGAFPKLQDTPVATYDQYLAKKIASTNSTGNATRYFATADLIYNFWGAIDLANTDQQYFNELNNLVNAIKQAGDLSLFVAPGKYTFQAGSDIVTSYTNWLATSAQLEGFKTLEIISI